MANQYDAISEPRKVRHADIVAKQICKLGNIKTAYDFGCGSGIYVQALISNNVDTLGIDINESLLPEQFKTPIENIRFLDLAEKFIHNGFEPRDLVISIELAEHIEKSYAFILFQNIVKLAKKWIFMTASPEAGKYHLNPRPREYWIEGIERFGYHEYHVDLSENTMEFFRLRIPITDGLMWFKRDLMIFKAI